MQVLPDKDAASLQSTHFPCKSVGFGCPVLQALLPQFQQPGSRPQECHADVHLPCMQGRPLIFDLQLSV